MTRSPKPRLSPASVERLLREGIPLRDLLKSAGLSQVQLARRTRLRPSRLSRILSGDAERRKQGLVVSRRVFQVAADWLGVALETIPEAAIFFREQGATDDRAAPSIPRP